MPACLCNFVGLGHGAPPNSPLPQVGKQAQRWAGAWAGSLGVGSIAVSSSGPNPHPHPHLEMYVCRRLDKSSNDDTTT